MLKQRWLHLCSRRRSLRAASHSRVAKSTICPVARLVGDKSVQIDDIDHDDDDDCL